MSSDRFHIDPDARVDVPEDGETGNVITIRARMNVDTFGRLKAEIKRRNTAEQTEAGLDAAPVAMLLHNILAWRGPDFDDLPCTPENICALPPAELDPFIEKVVNEIAERNKKRTSPNAKAPATDRTSASAGAADWSPTATGASAESDRQPVSLQLATTIPRSPLRSALIGRLSKSDG
jgi:hypothetical protein